MNGVVVLLLAAILFVAGLAGVILLVLAGIEAVTAVLVTGMEAII